MRHGLKLPSRTREERVQQRLSNIENRPPPQTSGAVQVDSGGGRIRLIIGRVSTFGGTVAIQSGTGFTAVRNAVGDVTITFSTDFRTLLAITLGNEESGTGSMSARMEGIAPTAHNFRYRTYTAAGAAVEGTVHFIATGQA